MQQVRSYIIFRAKDHSSLVIEENDFFMKKNAESNVYITLSNISYGLIHDNKKIYAFVEISKKGSVYNFKNLDNGLYFCSKPLSINNFNNDREPFIADRLDASIWEEFELKTVEIEFSDYYLNFIDFLSKYKKNDRINLYWWRDENFINLGDELNPYIISYLTNKKVERVDIKATDLIAVGSILDWFPQRQNRYNVWGTGTLAPTKLLEDKNYSVSLLRGPLTQSLFSKKLNIPYGDPGILASLIWKSSSIKLYDWGLIVHHTQIHQHWVQNLMKNTPNSVLISVKDENIKELMTKISSCKNIASTSLHGLVIADSYCIPNIWLWTYNLHRGGQWKFFDYFSGINRFFIDNINPLNIRSLSEIKFHPMHFEYFTDIECIQSKVIKSFPL